MTLLQKIEDRAFKTYKSRLRAAERLKLLGGAWNFSLISLASAGAIASIGLLSDPKMYGTTGPTFLAAIAVLSLVVSLVVASQSYGARSRDMFQSYRRVQRIATAAESLRLSSRKPNPKSVKRLLDLYNTALDESENHTPADYQRAFNRAGYTIAKAKSDLFLAVPILTLAVPVLVLIPFVAWVVNAIVP